MTRAARTPEKTAAFLDALAEGATVTMACEHAGIGRRTVYDWRTADEAFAKQWEVAYEIGTEALEDEAQRRAADGVNKPVFYKGELCGCVREYSDTLLIFLLKARKPEKYRERIDHRVSGRLKVDKVERVIVDGRNDLEN